MKEWTPSFDEKDKLIKEIATYYCENLTTFNIDEFFKVFDDLSENIQRIIKVLVYGLMFSFKMNNNKKSYYFKKENEERIVNERKIELRKQQLENKKIQSISKQLQKI